jgi:hypothetical protein
MSEAAEEQFLVEGVRRYAQALDTIRAFETMLGERLREVLKGYACAAFAPNKEPINTGFSDSTGGRVVWAARQGALRGKRGTVWLEHGLWWLGGEVAYYCGFVDLENREIDFEYTRNHARVEYRKWSRKARLFMLVPPDKEIALESDLRLLLDELTSSFV